MLGFRISPVPKSFMDKGVGGSVKIFSRNFSVSQCRKISQWNPSVLCVRKIPVAKAFMDKRGGGENQGFPSEFFVSNCGKISEVDLLVFK